MQIKTGIEAFPFHQKENSLYFTHVEFEWKYMEKSKNLKKMILL